MPTHKSPRARAQAVAKIRAGVSTAAAEAMRLNTHKRTVEKWVVAAEEVEKAVEKTAPQSTIPPEEGPEKPENPALDAALAAAGEESDGEKPAAPGAAAVAEARLDMAAYCLDAIAQFKQAVGGILVTARYTPPLDLAAKDVQKLLAVGPVAQLAVRANAEKLYPMLVKVTQGPGMIYAALAIDTVLMLVGLEALAKQSGWKGASKGDAPANLRPARGGSPMDLAEQIERARKDMGEATPIPGGLPKTDAPSTGTINAPPA